MLRTMGGQAWATLTASRQAFLLGLHRLIPVGEESAVVEYLRTRGQSEEIGAAVAAFLVHLRSKARSSAYVKQVEQDLQHLAVFCPGRVRDISADMLRAWHAERTAGTGSSRIIGVRAAACSFWKWARREGIAGNEAVTPAERIQTAARSRGDCQIITRAQLEAVLAAVPVKHRAWVAIGAWAGLRPEEIAPKKSKLADGRRGLCWEDIDFTFNQIRVSAETSKVNCARLVPLCPVLRAFLEPLRSTGPVCAGSPVADKTLRDVGVKVFGGSWPKDALRHSYGSYRNALLRDLPKVAEEMGTSVSMLHRHYHNPQAKELGEEWFEVPQISHKNEGSHSA